MLSRRNFLKSLKPEIPFKRVKQDASRLQADGIFIGVISDFPIGHQAVFGGVKVTATPSGLSAEPSVELRLESHGRIFANPKKILKPNAILSLQTGEIIYE